MNPYQPERAEASDPPPSRVSATCAYCTEAIPLNSRQDQTIGSSSSIVCIFGVLLRGDLQHSSGLQVYPRAWRRRKRALCRRSVARTSRHWQKNRSCLQMRMISRCVCRLHIAHHVSVLIYRVAAFALAHHDKKGRRLPQAIAHRGYKARYPENTMAAFKGAIAVGTHALETDIHLSKDNVVVLSHVSPPSIAFPLT